MSNDRHRNGEGGLLDRDTMSGLRERLRCHVDVLSELIGERNSRRPSAIEAAASYVRRQLVECGLSPVELPYTVTSRACINLEATIEGRVRASRPLVVGAHYDTAIGTPGADDNASAVAVLLEVARWLATHQPRRTVHCAFYDTEEMPHFATDEMGSQHHATQCRTEGRPLLGMICLESVGYFGPPQPNVEHWSNPLLRLAGGKHLFAISNLRSAGFAFRVSAQLLRAGWWRTITLPLPERMDLIHLSDHRSYWERGYKAVMLTDTAVMRNPNYHQPTDRLQSLDFDRMTSFTSALRQATARL